MMQSLYICYFDGTAIADGKYMTHVEHWGLAISTNCIGFWKLTLPDGQIKPCTEGYDSENIKERIYMGKTQLDEEDLFDKLSSLKTKIMDSDFKQSLLETFELSPDLENEIPFSEGIRFLRLILYQDTKRLGTSKFPDQLIKANKYYCKKHELPNENKAIFNKFVELYRVPPLKKEICILQ